MYLRPQASGIFVAHACANSFLRDAAPAGARVSAAGMYICSYYIGGTVGGVLPGLFWDHSGWPGCVALVIVVLLAAGFRRGVWMAPAVAGTGPYPAIAAYLAAGFRTSFWTRQFSSSAT